MMILIKTLASLLLMIGTLSIAVSQECDTVIESKDTAQIYYFYNNLDSLALGRLHDYRMQLAGVNNYEEIFKETPFFASLGNPGLAYKNLLFNPLRKTGFDFGIHSFDAY